MVAQVEELLVRYQELIVALPQAETLTIKRDEAHQWSQMAKALLAKPLSEDLVREYKVSFTGIHRLTRNKSIKSDLSKEH